jgi:superfamily I DNA/RNA helicase
MLQQKSIRTYKKTASESLTADNKIHFLVGNSSEVKATLSAAIRRGAVVLTRAWAAAFNYIEGIDEGQSKLLKDIYNSYYNSPIKLRDEIAEHNNVTWVRAFRFIFRLWESHVRGSFIDVVKAIKLYADIDINRITPKILFQIRNLSESVFTNVSSQSITTHVIDLFNEETQKEQYSELISALFPTGFTISIFDELEKEKVKNSIRSLTWETSYKLFTDVFSENSHYMTVHQAKGLEWDKVIVSVTPNAFDETDLNCVYSSPDLTKETPSNEFVRMYYVACSRAKDDLYIHIANKNDYDILTQSIVLFANATGQSISYDLVL